MVQPTDFISPLLQAQQATPSLGQSFGQGQQIGSGLLGAQQQGLEIQGQQLGLQNARRDQQWAQEDRTAQQQALAQAQQAAIAKAQRAVALHDKAEALVKNGVTSAGIEALIAQFPEVAEQYKALHASKNEQEKADTLSRWSLVDAAMKNGADDVAIDLLETDAKALEKQRPREAQQARKLAEMVKTNRNAALLGIGGYLVANGGKEYVEGAQKVEQGPAALARAEADAKKAQAEADAAHDKEMAAIDLDKARASDLRNQIYMRGKQFGLDEKRLQIAEKEAATNLKALEMKMGELSEKQQGVVADSVVGAALAGDAAKEYDAAAKIYEDTASGVGGVLASPFNQGVGLTAKKAVTGALGVATEMDKADQALLRAEMAEARARRPPGSGTYTDADAERDARAAISLTTTPEAKAARMRELAAKNRKAAVVDSAKAQYLTENGSFGNAKKDIVVGGKLIKQGQSFEQAIGAVTAQDAPKTRPTFSDRGLQLKNEGKTIEQARAILAQEGYDLAKGM